MPAPSARITGVRWVAGRCRPGLSFAMAGSFHAVILPVKIFVMVAADSRSVFTWRPAVSLMLYIMAVPPATSGRYW